MGRRESHEPGTFCAVDLATTDDRRGPRPQGAAFVLWEGELED